MLKNIEKCFVVLLNGGLDVKVGLVILNVVMVGIVVGLVVLKVFGFGLDMVCLFIIWL